LPSLSDAFAATGGNRNTELTEEQRKNAQALVAALGEQLTPEGLRRESDTESGRTPSPECGFGLCPAYRGSFIAGLSRRITEHLPGTPPWTSWFGQFCLMYFGKEPRITSAKS
jgi:hypothetical protein